MEDYLIVDGYNIINSWSELVSLKKGSYAHAREKLVEILSDYRGFSKNSIVVVFDAHKVKGGVQVSERIDGVEVIYTKEGQTADNLIERIVSDLPKEKIVGVATSDWVEQRIILGKGAYRLTPRDLYERIADVKDEKGKYLLPSSKAKGKFKVDIQLNISVRTTLNKWRKKKS